MNHFFVYTQQYPNLISQKEVSSIGYWKLGEKVSYEVSETSQRIDGKKKPKTVEKSYSFSLEIIDSTTNSYTFEMTFGSFNSSKKDPILSQIDHIKSNTKIQYKTDEFGVFDTILNIESIRDMIIQKVVKIQQQIRLTVSDSNKREIYDEAFNTIKSSFEELENTESLFLNDILFLHGYFGISLQIGKPLDIELNYPCLGDYILTGKGTVSLSTISPTANECMFTVNEKPNQQELVTYLNAIASYFFLEDQKKPLFHNLKLSMKSQNKMKMELSSGWMKKISNTSTTTIKDLKKEYKFIVKRDYTKI